MKQPFQTRAMIFTLYGDYIRRYGNAIWIGSLIRLLEAFGHNEQAVRAAISRMGKQGWVKSTKIGNKSYYSLTEPGRARMEEASKRIYKSSAPDWDGRWRILVYTIPEKKRRIRDELRKELTWSGFGPLTNSCWITPNPLEKEANRLIDKYGIHDYVSFFQATYAGMDEQKKMIDTCWNLTDVNQRFREFIHEYRVKYANDKEKLQNNIMSDSEAFVQSALLVHQYRKFLFIDPNLPKELLPEGWLGDTAARLFTDYNNMLAKPATRFFESVFEPVEMGAE